MDGDGQIQQDKTLGERKDRFSKRWEKRTFLDSCREELHFSFLIE
jgi:hypothetical protein